MKTQVGNYLRINFEYPKSLEDWLNENAASTVHCATWHNPGPLGTGPAGDYSDIFLHVENGEFSDELPEEVQVIILTAVEKHNLIDCVVWLSNVKEPETVEWAFNTTGGDTFDGYDTPAEAFEGMQRLIEKGYSPKDFTGIYPVYEEL